MTCAACATRSTEVRSSTANIASHPCSTAALAVQVLGSGGPIPDDARASSGYLVWIGGKARVLVDAGGGVFQRFGEAGAHIDDLDVIALSHLHVDHSVDLVALLKGGYFSDRRRELLIVGPSGNSDFPSTDVYLRRLIGSDSGAYAYLGGYLTGDAGWFPVLPRVVETNTPEPRVMFDSETFELTAVPVTHGHAPALGYVLTIGDTKLAFSGDQNGLGEAFPSAAQGAELLIAHHAIPEHAGASLRELHMTPSRIGVLAARIAPQRLVLSHHMQRALTLADESAAEIARAYGGPVDFAEDLDCYTIPGPASERVAGP